MTEKKNTPAIRFKEFTDAWEQRELRTAASFSKGSGYSKNDLKENGTPIILYGRLYTKYETVISEVDTFVDVQPNSVYSTGHEVIVPASGETAEDISRASFVAKSGILLGGDLNIIVPDDYINPAFLALTISNGNQQKELSKRAQGKSVVHIHNSDLENVVLLYPSYNEQEKIGAYFSKLDTLITLHQRKLDKLHNVKKSMLAKMFPKGESKVPEIRFKGFTDAWEQRKLGDYSEIVAGGTPNTGHPEYWNPKEIPWMSSGEINNKVIYSTDNMISKIGFSNSSAKWVKEKSVLIALAGQGKTRGTVAISEIPLTTNQSIAAIQPDSFLYYKFLFQNLEGRYNELREVSSGDGTRGGLNKQIISDLEVLAPEIQEQIKIGDFLCGIDNLITLHQRKLEKLKNIKKSMLEKMFV